MTDKHHWRRVTFGDVVRLNTDRVADPLAAGIERYVGLEHIEPEDLRIRRWGQVAEGTTFTNRFRPGQVLFGKRRAYLRKVAVADFEGVCSSDIYVFESKDPNALLPELLPFLCQTDGFFKHAVGTSAGSLSPRTNWTQLAAYEFALPPLEEQRRMVQLFEGFEEAIDTNRQAEESRSKLMASFVERFISCAKHSRALGDLLIETSYGSSSKSSYEPLGFPILRIPNILRGILDLTDLQWLQLNEKEASRYLLQAGDILIVRTNGNPDYVGRCVVVPFLDTPMVYASYLIRLRVNMEQAMPEYVAAMLNSPSIRRKLRGDVRSSAGNYNLNTTGIKRQKVPFANLEQQRDFVDKITRLNDAGSRLSLRLQAVHELKRRTLSRLE